MAAVAVDAHGGEGGTPRAVGAVAKPVLGLPGEGEAGDLLPCRLRPGEAGKDLVVEAEDLSATSNEGVTFAVHAAKTIMETMADREDLARAVLLIADQMRSQPRQRTVAAP